MTNDLSKSYLFWKAKNKDPESFAKVYDLYIDKIFRFVYFKVSDQELAQDFAADTFLKTWEYINSGKKVDNLNALIYRIARNLVIDYYRKKSTKDVSLDSEILEIQEERYGVSLGVQMVDQIDAKIDLEKLKARMMELKDEYRDVLILKHIEEFSIAEISAIIEKKPGAVRVTLHRATKALETLLGEE